jgi:Mn-dependent DtxR family transcriptional regulator
VKYLGLPLDHVHEPAHRVEHFIGPRCGMTLTETRSGRRRPHGQEIPS